MKQLSVISVTLLALLLLSTSALAWSNCKTKPCKTECGQTRHTDHLERMAVILDLTPEQQQQMAEARATHQQKRNQLRTELQAARQQLNAAQSAPAPDVEELKTMAQNYAELKAAMLVNKIEHKQQMFNLLTPEQQKKAAKLKTLKSKCNKGKCKGCECKGDACSCAGANCPAECCAKNLNKCNGCCDQGKNCRTNCNKQTPCMMKNCR